MYWVLLAAIIIAALYTDLRSMTIPNWLSVGGTMLGLVWHFADEGWSGLAMSFIGAAAGFGVALTLHVTGAVGAGDVKLFAAIGSVGGIGFALTTLMYSVFVAAVVGLLLLASRKRLLQTAAGIWGTIAAFIMLREVTVFRRWKENEAFRFPFMIAVAPGAALAFAMMPNG